MKAWHVVVVALAWSTVAAATAYHIGKASVEVPEPPVVVDIRVCADGRIFNGALVECTPRVISAPAGVWTSGSFGTIGRMLSDGRQVMLDEERCVWVANKDGKPVAVRMNRDDEEILDRCRSEQLARRPLLLPRAW